MAHSYRYFTADLLTGDVLGELPLYGVYMDKQLNTAGNFTGTFRLGTNIEDDVELIGASYPQRSAIYCQRDGQTVWGGIIWSRTFGSQAGTIQLSAQTFESYIWKVLVSASFTRNQNQLQTAIDLITTMQAQARCNIGIDTSYVSTTGGYVKLTEVPYYDLKFFGEVFGELASSEDGFDFTINVLDGPTIDHPIKQLILGQPRIIPLDTDSETVYDYPGSITDFYWPESGSDGATDFTVLGAGQGSDMLIANAVWPGAALYARVDKIFNYKNVLSQTTLNAIAQDIAKTYGPTATVPTITLASDRDPEFDQWNNLGSLVQLEMESVRWPNEHKVFVSRMIGWEFKPGDSESIESIKLRIDGED
jgi:hypothetical protein